MVPLFFYLHGKHSLSRSPPAARPPLPPGRAALFQAVFIPLGICYGGGYSQGPRGKNQALDNACRAMCMESKPAYEGGRCPSGGIFRGGGDCPPECIREASPAGAWVGSFIEAIIMVGALPAQAPRVDKSADYFHGRARSHGRPRARRG
jgi:hypothetical protein